MPVEVGVEALVERLIVAEIHWQEMASHITAFLPEEACGLVGGKFCVPNAQVEIVIPVPNQLHSPARFRMDPAAQLHGLLALDELGLDLVAIFHSHPAGPETPSLTDLEEFAYPGVLSLIFSPLQVFPGWKARAFHLTGGLTSEVRVTRLAG